MRGRYCHLGDEHRGGARFGLHDRRRHGLCRLDPWWGRHEIGFRGGVELGFGGAVLAASARACQAGLDGLLAAGLVGQLGALFRRQGLIGFPLGFAVTGLELLHHLVAHACLLAFGGRERCPGAHALMDAITLFLGQGGKARSDLQPFALAGVVEAIPVALQRRQGLFLRWIEASPSGRGLHRTRGDQLGRCRLRSDLRHGQKRQSRQQAGGQAGEAGKLTVLAHH